MNKKIIINYICEVNYPTTSAYGLHVLKMCDAFAKENKVNLILPFSSAKKNKLDKDYLIKNHINYSNILKKKISFNFIKRIYFSILILKKFKQKKNEKVLYISRSIIFAIIACLKKKNIILELHHELSGLTKFFYNILKITGFLKKLKYILIHRNLVKTFNLLNQKNYIVLDDAVDIKDFKNKSSKKFRNTCVYVGSFHKGKGLELIIKLAEKLKKFNFHIYGDKNFLNFNNIPKNIKIFNYIKYKNIPIILSKYHVVLMPYSDFVFGRLTNVNLVKSMSPLKMFDYLASGNIILASRLKIYNHILKHKKNAILISNSNLNLWSKWIYAIFKRKNKFNYLRKNATSTAKRYTWLNRSKKIMNFAKEI